MKSGLRRTVKLFSPSPILIRKNWIRSRPDPRANSSWCEAL